METFQEYFFKVKPNKRDWTLVKSYKVIRLFNCLSKVVEKFVIKQLSQFCEPKKLFHREEIEGRKNYSTTNVVTFRIYKFYKIWEDKEVISAFLIDVKGIFNLVLQEKPVQKMVNHGIDNDLLG